MSSKKPFSAARHLKRYGLLWVVILLLAALLGGYTAGYRVGPGLSIVKAGTLVIPNLPANTSIYVDSKLRSVVRDGGEYHTRLVPGTHAVIVDALNMTPWHEAVTLAADGATTVSPVLIATSPSGTILKGPERDAALAAIAGTKIPTELAPLRAGCTDVYVSQNRLIGRLAPGCTPVPAYLCEAGECAATVLLEPVDTITSVVLYPERTDTLLFTVGDWIYVLDIDPREPRFFTPYLRRNAPLLGPATAEGILIRDEKHVYQFTI